jgi:fluoride exporter
MLKNIALVFLGGGAGSVIRFLMGRWVVDKYNPTFPWATLVVNIVASAVLGCIMALYIKKPDANYWMPLLLGAGFCGGLSTFSTFSYEGFVMLQQNEVAKFAIYTLASVVTCIIAAAAGYYTVK